jgi:hypothetical protein
MAKKTIADASAELYRLLEPFESGERERMVKGTLMLLGDGQLAQNISAGVTQQQGNAPASVPLKDGQVQFDRARKFFDTKQPIGVIEGLATAARFFEMHGGSAALRKDDFKAVFDGARRNFAARNFARDLGNATQGGYFNAGGGKKAGYTLSHYGQDYIDALPDRAAAKAVVRPKRAARSKAKRKKAQGG